MMQRLCFDGHRATIGCDREHERKYSIIKGFKVLSRPSAVRVSDDRAVCAGTGLIQRLSVCKEH
jgi:hypothetical protein